MRRFRSVHHAEFVLFENDTRLGMLTWYDGPFEDYIVPFVEAVGGIFAGRRLFDIQDALEI